MAGGQSEGSLGRMREGVPEERWRPDVRKTSQGGDGGPYIVLA